MLLRQVSDGNRMQFIAVALPAACIWLVRIVPTALLKRCKPDVFQPGLKTHLAAQLLNFAAQVWHDFPQFVGPYMRLGFVENDRICACLYEFFQDFADAHIMYAGGQLAVRKSAGTAFTKLNIGFRIRAFVIFRIGLQSVPEFLHIPDAFIHGFAALDDDWS